MVTLKLSKIPGSILRTLRLFAYFCTISFTPSQISLAAEEIIREQYNVVDNLVVNNRNKLRTIIHESEAEGTAEMRKLIASSQTEESWVYLPDHEKWIEIGLDEEAEKKVDNRYITKARLNVKLLDELMSEYDNMVLYHFHPSQSLSLEDKIRERKEVDLPMNEEDIVREKVKSSIKSAYPSRADLLSMIGNSTEFFKRNPDGNITFKVCSHYGITEYYLTAEGITYLHADNSSQQISKIIDKSLSASIEVNVKGEIMEINPRETKDPLKRIKMSPKQKRKTSSRYTIIDPLTRIQKAVESMCDEHISVTFTPYK